MEAFGARKGKLIDMTGTSDGQIRLEFIVPSRGLIGFSAQFMSLTRGYGIMNHSFESYEPLVEGDIGGRRQGVLIANETGKATLYSLLSLEDRGTIFIEPGAEVYEGMIVGEHNRENDLTVNVTKTKHLTNIRQSTKENTVMMKKPRKLTLEEALQYLNDDELCEVTPKAIRLRKKILNKSLRDRAEKKKKYLNQQ